MFYYNNSIQFYISDIIVGIIVFQSEQHNTTEKFMHYSLFSQLKN